MLRKVVLVGLLAAGLIVVSLTNAHAGPLLKVGFVDAQRALNECRAGREALKILDELTEVRTKEVRAMEDEITQLEEELTKQLMLSEEARAQREDEIGAKREERRKRVGEVTQEYYKRESELTKPILRDIKGAIKRLGKEEGYSMILGKGNILYGADGLDLTDKIIRMLDKKRR